MRPCILNGITDFVERPDLADRSLLVTIEPIPEEARRPESEILREAAALWPMALGAFLAVVCKGLANLPSTRLPRLPRMADFALWATACGKALGWDAETFVKDFSAARGEMMGVALEAEPIVEPLRQLASEAKEWAGSATGLFKRLKMLAGLDLAKRLPEDWPKSPKSLGRKLKRLAPALRLRTKEIEGIELRQLPTGDKGIRRWVVRKMGENNAENAESRVGAGFGDQHYSQHSSLNNAENAENAGETLNAKPASDQGFSITSISSISSGDFSNGGGREGEEACVYDAILQLNGRPVDGLRLAELLGRSVESIEPALDELVRRGLIKAKGVSWLTSPVIPQGREAGHG